MKKLKKQRVYTNNSPRIGLAIFRWLVSIGILLLGYSAYFYIKPVLHNVFEKVKASVASYFINSVGSTPVQDEKGHINFMIVGYGGENHQWGMLADSIMLASFNPDLKATTFVSVPRDLYVRYPWWGGGRINALFASSYYRHGGNFDAAAQDLKQKLAKIMGINPDYYVLVSFQWFVDFVDFIGGIDVYLPNGFVDPKYPIENWGYTTFRLPKWNVHLDGETALKFVRSRHSTSDFSRSLRQQLVIKKVIQKILSDKKYLNPSYIKQLWWEFNKMVVTDLSINEMLGFLRYKDDLKHFFSFALNADCENNIFETLMPWCMLYFPPRDEFGGAAIILPVGATASNPEFYKNVKDFVFNVVRNQWFLIEDAKIKVLNGVDKDLMKQKFGQTKPLARQTAFLLKNNGYDIVGVANAPQTFTGTEVILVWSGTREQTLQNLKLFVPIDNVVRLEDSDYIDLFDDKMLSGVDILLVLGNKFIE